MDGERYERETGCETFEFHPTRPDWDCESADIDNGTNPIVMTALVMFNYDDLAETSTAGIGL
jgi:hypothetical protein